jgi:uncharacterized membrane protein
VEIGELIEDRFVTKRFLISLLLAIVLIASSLSFGIIQGYGLSKDEAETIFKSIKSIPISIHFIFLNNFFVTMLTFIPFLGILIHLFIQYSTGIALGAISSLKSANPLLLIVFASPIFFLEYVSYTIALSESLNISLLIIKKDNFKERIKKHSWKAILFTSILLFIGAVIETFLIKTFSP